MLDEQPDAVADRMLARIHDREHARLRVYIGAAPGVGKTYRMLRDAGLLKDRGLDGVVGFAETVGGPRTGLQGGTLEIVPRRRIPNRGVVGEDMDLDAVLARRPAVAL